MKKYAISDIHGHLKTFELLLGKIDFQPEDELYILGDMIDRGANSRGVLDKIMAMQAEGLTVHCLRGNHEQMMLDAIENQGKFPSWIRHGGAMTYRNFITEKDGKDCFHIPQHYIDFLNNLPYYHEVDDFILVHAGLDFSKEDPLSDTTAMMWVRNWWKDYHFLKNRYIVHGHSPISKPEMSKQLDDLETIKVIDIDNGCFYKKEGFNQLCAFNLTDKKLVFVENVG